MMAVKGLVTCPCEFLEPHTLPVLRRWNGSVIRVAPIRSIRDPRVREEIRVALAALGGVVAVIRVAGGAGSRHWFVLEEPEDLGDLLRWAKPVDAIDVFLEPQLQVRGTVDADIRSAIRRLPTQTDEWLIAVRDGGSAHLSDVFEGWNGDPDSATAAARWLDGHDGRQVLAGPHPLGLATASVLTAYVPLPNGTLTRGAY
jgi:hypothetical protein